MSKESRHRADLELACRAATAAGNVLRTEFGLGSAVKLETAKDIKLAADILAEEACLACLRSGSSYPILSEEAGADESFEGAGLRWVVDPLDGTFNYSRRLPLCCVSVGLWDGLQPVLGVIHDFSAGVTYQGIVGAGAWRGEESMQVSSVTQPEKAAISTGFPAGGDFGRDSLMGFIRQVQHYKKVRMIGSAALSLAFVAAGHVDVYHEDAVNLWDVAAGLALVKAAGGRFVMRPGTRRWQFDVFATNAQLPIPSGFEVETTRYEDLGGVR